MNVVREIERINELELREGISGPASWHHQYKDSAWVYVGGLTPELTEGDLLCIMSQWGEIEDCNLLRDQDTGKSKCFAFIKYCDQRSSILAVDNLTGAKLLGRTLRVDHVQKYRLPKELREKEEGAQPQQWRPGHAYEGKELSGEATLKKGVNVWDDNDGAPTRGDNNKAVDESGDDRDMSEKRKRKKGNEDRHHHKVKRKDQKRKKEKKEKKGKRGDIMAMKAQSHTEEQSTSNVISHPKKNAAMPIPDPIVQSSAAQAGGVADWRGLRTSSSAVGSGRGTGYRNGDRERNNKDPYRPSEDQGVPELYASNRTTHHHGMGGMSRRR